MIGLRRSYNRNETLAVMKLIIATLLMLAVASGQVPLTTAQIAKKVAPSVVAIHGKTGTGDIVGSGFIISKDGKIVTNLHVIRDLTTASVQLANGEIFDSISILATDERRDLAIIHVAGFDLAPLNLGNSNAATVGESVVVVGSPRGLEGTVTAGILSAVRDTGEGFKVLQTDSAVNPGNSGGPLVNGKGQVIGVVSFKLRSSEGLNFAVPINYVSGLLNELHQPMSLEQMRKSLVAQSAADGPSLKETLDWLKEKLPLAAAHYTFNEERDDTLTMVPIRFESCTVIFESRAVWIWKHDKPEFPILMTSRWTVPLGAIKGGRVIKGKPTPFVVPQTQEWVVRLDATSKVILDEDHDNLSDVTKTESDDFAILIFYEEPIANRVLEAFKHAAELCRGKEPF